MKKKKQKPTINYHYRGLIERSSGWCEGYSTTGLNGGIIYPWQTKKECQSEAKDQKKKAVFVR
jgi:hypothetical protein